MTTPASTCAACGFVNPAPRARCARCTVALRRDVAAPLPLIGQAGATAALYESIDRAFSLGRATTLAVVGPEGSGKSRLLAHAGEFGARAADRVRLLEATAVARDAARPYEPFGALLLERFGVTPDMPTEVARGQIAARVAEALPTREAVALSEVAHVLGHVAGIPYPDSPFLAPLVERPHELRRRVLGAIREFFEGASHVEPTLLLIDDAQHLSDTAWQVVHVLSAVDGHLALVLAGAPGIEVRLAQVGQEGRSNSIALEPLREHDIAAFLCVLLPTLESAPPDFVAALAHRTGGNPGVLSAMIPSLLRAGLFEDVEGTLVPRLDRLSADDMPISMDDAVAARLENLTAEERAALERAAVMGDRFWDAGLVAEERWEAPIAEASLESLPYFAAEQDRERVGATLRGLVEKGVIAPHVDASLPGATAYAFTMARLRERLYSAQDENLKVLRHTAVAGWLALTAELRREGIAALIAPHLEEAGWLHRAGRAYLEAAAYERARLHTHTALLFIEKALPLIPDEDVVRRIDAFHERGSLLAMLGRYDDALGAFLSMLEHAHRVGARAKAAAALNRIGRIHRERGEEDRAELVLDSALALFRAAGDLRGVAATLDDLAQVVRLRGRPGKALPLALEALELRRGHGDRRGEAVSLGTLGAIELTRGRLDAAELYYTDSLRIREALGDQLGVMQTHNALAVVAYEQGQTTHAIAAWSAALTLAREVGARREQTYLLNNLGEAHLALGDLRIARERLEEAHRLASALGDKRALAEIVRNLGATALAAREPNADIRFEEALRLAEEFGGREAIAHALRAIATARSHVGGADPRIEREFIASIELFRVLGNDREAAKSLAEFGRHLANRDERDAARVRLLEAETLMTEHGLPGLTQVQATLRALDADAPAAS